MKSDRAPGLGLWLWWVVASGLGFVFTPLQPLAQWLRRLVDIGNHSGYGRWGCNRHGYRCRRDGRLGVGCGGRERRGENGSDSGRRGGRGPVALSSTAFRGGRLVDPGQRRRLDCWCGRRLEHRGRLRRFWSMFRRVGLIRSDNRYGDRAHAALVDVAFHEQATQP